MGRLEFDENGALLFKGKTIVPKARTAKEMLPVVHFPEKMNLPDGEPTYYMYREADRFGNIRYDVTKIRPLDLCSEKNKTYGHVHPESKAGAAWAEVYEVLSGAAHFLLQKTSSTGVVDALLLSAERGDCLLIPPGYGHITINAGKGELILANLVSDDFEADYSMFAKRRGGCYYEMSDGKLVKNTLHYGSDFELRKMGAEKFSSQFGVFEPFLKASLLEVAKKRQALEFLEKPELFC